MRVGYLQFNPTFGETKRNLDFVADHVRRAECDLLVLPELFTTGYQFISEQEAASLAEDIPAGPTTERLLNLAATYRMHIVAGLAERAQGRIYNSAILVGPSGVLGVYRKIHLYAEENLWFTPGDKGFPVYDIGSARIGLMVCFDWFYPESVRTLALKGADIVAHPSNLVLPHCPDAMITRCLENRVFAVTCNRIGSEERGGKEKLSFIGTSEIVSPTGKILKRARRCQVELGVVDIDPTEARDKKINSYNDLLAGRRPAHYSS